MHTFETVCGLPKNSHSAMSTENMERRMRKYFGGNGTFDDWKSDPFLALITYYQLIEGFGWDTFYKVFAEYRTLDNSRRPRSDDKKRDMFLVMFSRAAGKNLGRFFEAWKIPVRKDALESIKDLPEWLPEPGFPGRYMQ